MDFVGQEFEQGTARSVCGRSICLGSLLEDPEAGWPLPRWSLQSHVRHLGRDGGRLGSMGQLARAPLAGPSSMVAWAGGWTYNTVATWELGGPL